MFKKLNCILDFGAAGIAGFGLATGSDNAYFFTAIYLIFLIFMNVYDGVYKSNEEG